MRLEEEIQAYRSDMVKLEEMATELANTEFIAGAVVRVEEDTEELIVPQVKMLYPYSGNNVEVKKDEVSDRACVRASSVGLLMSLRCCHTASAAFSSS